MYNTSEQFHNAVFQNSPVERVLMRFADNTIFTNEDIHQSGFKFIEAANLEDELTIGACPSSSFETTIMNDSRLLSGYSFGECEVKLGVRTAVTSRAAIDANVVTTLRYDDSYPITISGHTTEPYIRINGFTPTAQPPFPVYAIVTSGSTVYCASETGEVWVAAWVDGQTWSELSAKTWNEISSNVWDEVQGVLVPITDSTFWRELNETLWSELETTRWNSFVVVATFNEFMKAKFARWAAARRGLSYNSEVLYEFTPAGRVEKYEYVKIGTFLIDKPTKRNLDLITLTAYDRMGKFNVDATSFLAGITYPTTIRELYSALCTYVGVTSATTTFINSTHSLSQAPAQFEGVTCQEVLGWIAEAACSFARMTRDGELELAWFGAESVSIPATQYFSVDPAEYEVSAIDKLQILGTENDIGVIIGTGTNGYQILDNPCLYGASDSAIRILGTPIYNRLAAFSAFAPVTAKAVCDWSIQAGDIIALVIGGVTHTFPIYCQTITWNGCARVVYECTGSERRPVMNAVNRRVYNQKRSMHEFSVTVDGLTSRVSDAEGNITALDLTAQGLSIEVSSKVGNNEIISKINQSAEAITIAASKINLAGYVTLSSLGAAGSTQIDGARITTGHINSRRIDVDTLEVKKLNGATGTFTGSLTAVSTAFTQLSAGGGTLIVNSSGITMSGVRLYPYNGAFHIDGAEQIDMDCDCCFSNGAVYIRSDGIELEGSSNNVRILMNPPSGSGTAAHWVARGGKYSLGMYSSSRRYKHNINSFDENASSMVDALRPSWFSYIGQKERLLGFIAEEVAEVIPELVAYSDNGPDSVRYENITALLVADNQAMHDEIKALIERVKQLEEGGQSA